MIDPPPIDTVHIAFAQTDDPAVLARLSRYRALLDESERPRLARLVRESDRTAFLITRALVRTLLSRFVAVNPADWRFVSSDHGRPEIANLPPGVPALRFNISHTGGLVACAVTVDRDVGLDVEDVDRPVTYDVAGRFFAPPEVEALRALAGDRRRLAFFDYWTLKEAYIKARGLGLALPLRHFAFRLSDHAPPSIRFDDEIEDDPAAWQFEQAWATPRHRLALGVRSAGRRLKVHLETTVPEVRA